MKALQIHVGERARQHILQNGLSPTDIRLVPAAAGGPKGLMLTHLDQHLFGDWLPQGGHSVHLVGASIGAWRMATAAMPDPKRAFEPWPMATSTSTSSPKQGAACPRRRASQRGSSTR